MQNAQVSRELKREKHIQINLKQKQTCICSSDLYSLIKQVTSGPNSQWEPEILCPAELDLCLVEKH